MTQADSSVDSNIKNQSESARIGTWFDHLISDHCFLLSILVFTVYPSRITTDAGSSKVLAGVSMGKPAETCIMGKAPVLQPVTWAYNRL